MADTEAAQIKKVIEGALIVDDNAYLGTSDGMECHFSRRGLRVNGLPVKREIAITSLAGDLAQLEGTLVSYPSGYFKWISEGGASATFRIDIEGTSVETEFNDLKEYLENYFLTEDECLIGVRVDHIVYINSNWEVLIEKNPASSYIPKFPLDVDTSINPEVHAITPTLTITQLSGLSFMQIPISSSCVTLPKYGYNAYISYKDENGEDRIVVKNESICKEIINRWWNGFGKRDLVSAGRANAADGKIDKYVFRLDPEADEYKLMRVLGNDAYEELERGAYIHLDYENDTVLLGDMYIGVEDNGRHYFYIQNGIYCEKIYLDEIFVPTE